jgi:hypothetical protein
MNWIFYSLIPHVKNFLVIEVSVLENMKIMKTNDSYSISKILGSQLFTLKTQHVNLIIY